MPLFFKIFFVIGIVLFVLIFAFVMMMIFGAKTKSKFLARQIKSLKGMTDLSKSDIEDMMSNLSDATIKSKKRVLEENEDELKDIADTKARINKGAVKETAKAIKDGLTEDNKMYCKYCGTLVDDDSKFCKSCGKLL